MSAEVAMDSLSEQSKNENGDVLNCNVPDFSKESSENAPVKDERVIRKARRFLKQSSSGSQKDGDDNNASDTSPQINAADNNKQFFKNSRKSRTAKGRGLPKKGGAGGKGVWGMPGSEILDGGGDCNDDNDPNYDSDNQGPIVVQKMAPLLSDAELATVVQPILQEYLEHGDTEEVAALLHELNLGDNRYHILEMAVSLALGRHAPQRELTSQLLSDLCGSVLTRDDTSLGFQRLLSHLDDLTLDTPDAPTVVGQFIARAVADDCLAPKFVSAYKGRVDSTTITSALEKAEVLLGMKQAMARLDNVWGEGGGTKAVESLAHKMVLLLKEYLDSGDVNEATQCLKDLEVPHFHHELVYEAVVLAIERSSEKALDMMVSLLKTLTETNIVTPDEFTKGMRRVYTDMPDISIDVPEAYALLETLGGRLKAASILSATLLMELPARGRKRFVSEGDGGRLKDDPLRARLAQ